MTREEAIKYAESKKMMLEALIYNDDCKYGNYAMCSTELSFVNAALSALCPVSREQVEKVWPGCDICRGDKKIKSDNFCGAATMQIVGDSIDLRGDEKKIKFFGHIYAPSFSVRFCPFCGKPLTDEAVEMVMKRLEDLHEEN